MVRSVFFLGSVGGNWRLLGRRPGCEQPEALGGGGAGLCCVDEERESGFGGDDQLLVGEGELAGDGVMESFGAGAVRADVVVGPEPAEGLAAGGELPDEVLESAVVRVASRVGAHVGDAHL